MFAATLAVRVLLASVLGGAAIGKAADVAGTRSAIEDFGVPARLAGPAAVALPLIELAIAVGLLPAASAAAAAVAALVLFALFAVAIGRALRAGATPDCHCFGAIHSAPVTRATLARAVGLGALAALVVAIEAGGKGSSAVAWIATLSTTEALAVGEGVALVLVIAAAVALGIGLLRQNGRLLVRLEAVERALGVRATADGLPVGTPAPDLRLPDADGSECTLDELGRRVVLVFADAGCGPCRALFAQLADFTGGPVIAIVLTGDAGAAHDAAAGVRLLLAPDRGPQLAYGVRGTPTAVLVEDGVVASATAAGADAILRLLSEQSADREVVRVHR